LCLAAYLACWRVLDARVAGCDPVAPRVAGAAFGFALRDDTALVDGAALGLELDFDVADLRGLVDAWAERLLPRCAVGSLLTGPAVGVGGTGLTEG